MGLQLKKIGQIPASLGGSVASQKEKPYTQEIYSPILTVNYDTEWEAKLSGCFHNGMLIEQNLSAKVADQIKWGNAQNDEDECKLGRTAFHTSRQGD